MQSKFIALLFLCLLSLVYPLKGQHTDQQKQSVRLKKLLKTKDDTLKAYRLLEYASSLLDEDNEQAQQIARRALQLSKRLKYYNGMALASHTQGYVHTQAGRYREAIREFNNARNYYQQAGNMMRLTKSLSNIGIIYEMIGKPDSAMMWHMQALALLENTAYTSSLIHTYCAIGVLYGNTQEYEKAIFYKAKAAALSRETKDTVNLIEALTELADTYVEKGEAEKGFPLVLEALPLALKRGDKSILSACHYTISTLHLARNNADSAALHAQNCISNALAVGDINTYMGGALCLSDAYSLSNRQQERLKVLEAALAESKKAGTLLLLDDIYKRMADASYQLQDYKGGYNYYVKYSQYKDSVLNEKNKQAVSELEIKYQSAQKENAISEQQLHIAQQNLQLQKNRQYTTYSIATALVAFLIASLIWADFRSKKKIHLRQLRELRQQKEIQVLHAIMQGEERERSRISKALHDGVAGMLAAVKMHLGSLPAEAAFDKAPAYRQALSLLDEASAELRQTAHNLMPEVLLEWGLDEALRRYCRSISNENTLVVQYDSWGELKRYSSGFELSVYRIVQELLNNILKHSRATHAIVQLSQQEAVLSITVEDNGVGFSAAKAPADGMGLLTLKSRVEAINGKMQVDAADGSGVSAYLEFNTSVLERV